MAGVAVGVFLQIVLVLGFGFPERARGREFRYHFARPNTGCVDVRNGFFRDAPLLIAGVEDRRPVAGSAIVALAIERRRIVYLEKEFEQLPVADPARIEKNFDGFRMRAVIAVCRVGYVAAGVSNTRGDNAGIGAQQILHAPKAASRQNGALVLRIHVV